MCLHNLKSEVAVCSELTQFAFKLEGMTCSGCNSRMTRVFTIGIYSDQMERVGQGVVIAVWSEF